MYNNSKRNGARVVPISALIIVAVSPTYLSSMIVLNGNIADNVYAQRYSI